MNEPALRGPFQLGKWRVEPSAGRIVDGTRSVPLEPKVMQVLVCLTEAGGETVSRERLKRSVWPRAVSAEETLNRTIWKLRKALDDDPGRPSYLETIPKLGYRLLIPPETAAGARARRPFQPFVFALIVAAAGVLAVYAGWKRTANHGAVVGDPGWTRPLTTFSGYESGATFSPDGNQVIFQNYDKGLGDRANWNLWLKSVDGDQALQLTDAPEQEIGAAWSPDGSRVAFVRRDEERCGFYLMAPTGGSQRMIAPCPAVGWYDLGWTHDGEALLFSDKALTNRAGIGHLRLADGAIEYLTEPGPDHLGDNYPALSPDGSRVAFARAFAVGAGDLMLLDLQSGELKRLTHDHRGIAGVAWDHAGGRILFASSRGGNYEAWSISPAGGRPLLVRTTGRNVTGLSAAPGTARLVYESWQSDINLRAFELSDLGGEPQVVADATQWDWMPHFDPDGRAVAFVSDRSGAPEIWVADYPGGEPRRLTRLDGAWIGYPNWAPDGSAIAFSATIEGNLDVFRVDVPAGTLERIIDHPSRDGYASWGEDPDTLFFGSTRTGTWQIWRIDLGSGETAQLTTHGGQVPRLAPSGREVLFTKPLRAGLWSIAVDDPDAGERLVSAELPARNWADWTVSGGGVYFLASRTGARAAVLQRLDVDTGHLQALGEIAVWDEAGLAVSEVAGVAIVPTLDHSESDLWVVDGY